MPAILLNKNRSSFCIASINFKYEWNSKTERSKNWGVFHEAGLRESLAYLDNSGSFKREFRSTNVAYLNASWVTMVVYAAELACSWAGLRSSLA